MAWVCSYTPEEIIHAAGFQPVRLLAGDDPLINKSFPPNFCPYARQIAQRLEKGLEDELAGLVIANSCNAMMHLYNVARKTLRQEKNIFVYLLDLPRHQGPLAQAYFFNRLKEMSDFLGSQGKAVTAEALQAAVRLYGQTNKLLAESSLLPNPLFPPLQPLAYYDLAAEATAAPRKSINLSLERKLRDNGQQNGKEGQPYLLLTGTIPPRGLLELMEESAPFQLLQENCMTCRYFSAPDPAVLEGCSTREDILANLAASYLTKMPCPRLHHSARYHIYRQLFQGPNLKGLIFHDFGFCDLSHYDSLHLRAMAKEAGVPFLRIKTELGQKNLGQLKTRLEAFLEIIA
ncbi:MAG: 2-hydroxyacyl-CoA dehydratase [Firmicutes bacterium]|nr:2-hydroxyacyl-CoA dehydratase [Bacillota bacterium]